MLPDPEVEEAPTEAKPGPEIGIPQRVQELIREKEGEPI